MKKIMIIEDDIKIRKELSEFLSKFEYYIEAPDNFEDIVQHIILQKPHLVLLDINLPVYDGYYVCREVRRLSDVPIIIITSRDSEMDELMSMNLGADDFVSKPFNIQILLARISSLLKRTYSNISSDYLVYEDMKLYPSKSILTLGGAEIELTKNELRILHCLMENKGQIVSRDSLMQYLWDSELFIDDNTLTVNMNRLRKKLMSLGIDDPIKTKRGMGYIMP